MKRDERQGEKEIEGERDTQIPKTAGDKDNPTTNTNAANLKNHSLSRYTPVAERIPATCSASMRSSFDAPLFSTAATYQLPAWLLCTHP